jgi:hypothetical protein
MLNPVNGFRVVVFGTARFVTGFGTTGFGARVAFLGRAAVKTPVKYGSVGLEVESFIGAWELAILTELSREIGGSSGRDRAALGAFRASGGDTVTLAAAGVYTFLVAFFLGGTFLRMAPFFLGSTRIASTFTGITMHGFVARVGLVARVGFVATRSKKTDQVVNEL